MEDTDGTTNTYLAGEKYINPDSYFNGGSWGDDCCVYSGHDWDIVRWTWADPSDPLIDNYAPRQDRPALILPQRFGSAHPGALHFVLCDGSVRAISYSIDPFVHTQLGNRKDGIPVDISAL